MTVTTTERVRRTSTNETLSQSANLYQHTAPVVLPTSENPSQSLPSSNSFEVHNTINLFGSRPIVTSELHVSNIIHAAGVRPIAANKSEKEDLITYLD